jgi:DNA-binding transcriptional LysR family regulator
MNLSTRQMRAFLHVARIGNFTRAAEHAHITQAGLSILVREMERQLGCRLFDRTTRRVALTPAGRKLLPVVERMVGDLDEIAAQLGSDGDAARRSVRVAATPLVSSNLLPQVFKALRAAHPQIGFKLFDADLRDVEAMVAAGEVDLGLGFFFKAAAGLDRIGVGRFELMRVSPPDGSARAGIGTVPWSALRAVPLVALPPTNPIQKVVEAQLARIGRGGEERPVFNFFDTLISMVDAGFGTAVMPTFALTACRRHRVRTDVLVRPRVGIDFYRITRRGAVDTEAMQAFTRTLVQALPALSR